MEAQETTRMLKVGRQIQRDLSEIFQLQGMATYNGALISVTSVHMSPDLSLAKVWLSIFPSEKAAETLRYLNKENKTVRGLLGRRIAKQMRIVPELSFFLDDSLDYVEHIDRLLRK